MMWRSLFIDEQDIQSITSVIMDRFGNPFTISSDVEELENPATLINIATGVVAPDEVTKELLTGKELGRTALTLIGLGRGGGRMPPSGLLNTAPKWLKHLN